MGGHGRSSQQDNKERRRAYRIEAPGTAFLWHEQHLAGRYEMLDLSLAGCRLSEGPPRPVGDDLEIDLFVEQGAVVRARVRVARVVAIDDGWQLGLCFREPTAELQDELHELVLRRLEHPQGYPADTRSAEQRRLRGLHRALPPRHRARRTGGDRER
ncbi:MAG: PilZ domain-containing protein [Myxococcales bacterium]